MLKNFYATSRPNETQTDRNIALLDDVLDLCHRLDDFIVRASKITIFAHKTLAENHVQHRLPEIDATDAVELLADVADLRDELESQMEAMDYKRQKANAVTH